MIRRLLLRQGAIGLAIAIVLIVTATSAWADSIDIPNAEFLVYKPGTNQSVYATNYSGFAPISGTTVTLYGNPDFSSTATWSDGSTSSANNGVNSDTLDFPYWAGTGAVQDHNLGDTILAQNNIERVHSTSDLGKIAANTEYTLSATAKGVSFSGNSATFNRLYLELLGGGTAVTTASEITTTGDWTSYSVTFTADQLKSFVGQTLAIEVGGFAGYDQVQIDNVSLTYKAVPEPTTLVSLASFACTVGLFLGLRRRIRR